jgi:deoxycytidine triphosphate deaminase
MPAPVPSDPAAKRDRSPRPLGLPPGSDGVLPGQLLEVAIRAGYIDAGRFKIPHDNIQPASLDLRVGERAYRIRCSFLPGTSPVRDKLDEFTLHEIDLRGDGAMLESGRPYLVELKEQLDLPEGLRGKANPKSSTGRIDVFTRVITDRSERFDEIANGYRGALYLEVVPLSFAIRIREDLTLNQLRLSVGRPMLSDAEVAEAHRGQPLLYKYGAPVPSNRLLLADGLFLGLDLKGDESGQVGYSSRENAPLLDLGAAGGLDPGLYWDRVRREPGDRLIRKWRPSAFFRTDLEVFLGVQGIDTLLVCGTSVSGCVRATVTDAFMRDIRCMLVREAVAERTPAVQDANLFDLDQKYADVVSLAEALGYLERFPRAARATAGSV